MIMMTPGLRALAKRQRKPVKLLVPRKFFPIFENNPHVELIDINGPAIDVTAFARWINLSDCPAAAYKSRKRPNVRKGRVELFARAMRIRKWRLTISGLTPDLFLSRAQDNFCTEFLVESKLSVRPIVGVQPYARDSYKDHPNIGEIIRRLQSKYDVIIFHHSADGLSTFGNVTSTAGLSLSQSLALVSKLDAMIAVDSAFLHAAAAFDVPVIGLFGPTDGKMFTRHHRNAIVLDRRRGFPCVPCWRNEDLPCLITGETGYSSCISGIEVGQIMRAVDMLMRLKVGHGVGKSDGDTLPDLQP